MRIALVFPTSWPYARRGTERHIHELAGFLSRRGHDVTVISSKQGRGETIQTDGYRRVCHRSLWHPAMSRVGIHDFHVFPLTTLLSVLRDRFQLVHCFSFPDAYAACLARRFTRVPVVLTLIGIYLPVAHRRSISLGGGLYRRSVMAADEVFSFSEYGRQCLKARLGRAGLVMPAAVDMEKFEFAQRREDGRPKIVCAAALDDPRKGGAILMRAFERLKTRRPDTILQLCGPASPATQRELTELVAPSCRGDVEFLTSTSSNEVPRLFSEASISVLPSLWEVFGMVVLESMATGTPAVGARHGAIPELINQPAVGALFDPGPETGIAPTNVEGLAEAMEQALELSSRKETAQRCRSNAERFSWTRVGPQFEQVYRGLAGGVA